jgi:Ca2+-binding RTX toxin-like protein
LTIADDDQVTCQGFPVTQTGTTGNDTINGTSGADVIQGLTGKDTINGLGGNDRLCGDAGNDIIRGGLGNDIFDGGTGLDIGTYLTSPAPVTANLSTNTANGEGSDTFVSVEHLIGSRLFADILTGNGGANALSGRGGDDRLNGGAGTDTCNGGPGTGDTATACEQRSGIP